MLALLPADLRELRLLSVQQLSDRDMAAVARFTRLRELAVHSIGNHQVSHAALKVGGLGQMGLHVVQLSSADIAAVQRMWSGRWAGMCDGCVCPSHQPGGHPSGMSAWNGVLTCACVVRSRWRGCSSCRRSSGRWVCCCVNAIVLAAVWPGHAAMRSAAALQHLLKQACPGTAPMVASMPMSCIMQ